MTDDRYQPWSAAVLQGCAAVLAGTSTGLTGSQIGALLAELRIPDVNPSASKRDRLYAALAARQHDDRDSKRVATFVSRVMDPARYVDRPHEFTMRQDRLNRVLTFAGLRINDKGQVATGAGSTTLTEAARHATTLLSELERRRTHPEVLLTAPSSCFSRTTSTPAWRRPRASSCGYANSPGRPATGQDW